MKRRGSALLMIATLSTLLVLTAVLISISAVSNMNVSNDEKTRTKMEFACEAGLKRARAKIEQSFNNGELTILEPTVTFQGDATDDTGNTPEEKAFSDEEFMTGSGSEPDYYTFKINSDINNQPITVKYAITRDEDWHMSQSYTTYTMNIEAVAYMPGYGWVGMNEVSASRRTTLFMYSVFFQNDLEILPGPNFTLKGLIHTNGNMYLNSNSGSTLKILTDSLTSAGKIYRRRLDSNSYSGTVQISKKNENGSLVTMNSGSIGNADDSGNSNWTSIATNKWQGTVKDQSLGATVQEAPKLKSFSPGGYYDTNADLKINVLTKGYTKPVYQITYNGVTKTYNSGVKTNGLNGALTETTFYDRRESTTKLVKATAIDMTALADLGYVSDNGLVYLTRDDAVSGSVVSGFKLYNGSELSSPSTIVSNLPTYIQGDFNLHTSTNPATDTWQPCAVISDAINLLSNSWVDSKSSSTQPASSTTYNLVFITGNTATTSGSYNGGLENFPRFLENWSGQNVNISGGFIQLFRSLYATGKWGGSYYSAPNRNWQEESYFSDLRDLPPGFANMFPSTNVTIVYSQRRHISKAEAILSED